MTQQQRRSLYNEQLTAFDRLCAADLSLDLTRGKPASEQLDLSNALLALPGDDDYIAADGSDVRNYGQPRGLRELREIFSPILQVPPEQIVAGENASLAMMHDCLVHALLVGTPDSAKPWAHEDRVAFLCPVPGYDRHFALCEQYGIEMIPVDLHDDGPDMDQVRSHITDPAVKGMWLVPTYANPTGAVISEDVAAELAALDTAATDFRIMWDNAYAVHHLGDEHAKTPDILGLSVAAGNPNRPLIFASTSKITFAGAGVCFLGGSEINIDWYVRHMSKRTIGPDKVNQLRHARFLGDTDGVRALMDKHRAILAPKFDLVTETLARRLGDYQFASWTRPRGGYFVSLDVMDGTASRVVELCRQAGIAMTPAGAAYPYGHDPHDRTIRIAPSYPPLEELRTAIDGLCTCVLLAATEASMEA